jgi:peptidoglycan/LPS O-acetylase OafA/YrhL
MEVSSAKGHRSIAIDAVRGIAIGAVLLRHFPPGPEPVLTKTIAQSGWVGVDLFFVLSGFLISSVLFKDIDTHGKLDFARFWTRRGLRIWPAYFVCFLGVIALQGLTALHDGRPWSPPVEQWPNLLLIQNYFPLDVRWPHTWSLAVEEHFYLALPILLLVFGRGGLVKVGIGLIVACLAIRLALAAGGAPWQQLYYPTHTRFDGLMVGVLVGYVVRYKPEWATAVARRWLAIAALVVAAWTAAALIDVEGPDPFMRTWGFTLLAAAFAGLVMLASQHRNFGRDNILVRAVAGLGVYSYTIYLAHGAIIELPGYMKLLRAANELGGVWLARTVYLSMSIAGGWLLAKAVEEPFLALRDRLDRKRNPRPANAGVEARV